jgi:hypothetical protein
LLPRKKTRLGKQKVARINPTQKSRCLTCLTTRAY